MQQCLLIYDNSLKFSRIAYGILVLVAFLIQNPWLVLATTVLMAFGVISVNYNLAYQIHSLTLRKLLKNKLGLIKRESGELTFSGGVAGGILFISFLFLYFGKFVDFAWGLILIDALLLLLAGIANICVASLMYAAFKKISKR